MDPISPPVFKLLDKSLWEMIITGLEISLQLQQNTGVIYPPSLSHNQIKTIESFVQAYHEYKKITPDEIDTISASSN